jgi:hypothetical protein
MSERTKTERNELAQLVRRREKVAKADAERVGAERLATFEAQVATDYHLNDDAVWSEAFRAVRDVAIEADQRVAERCRELGIDERFRPHIGAPSWYDRGEHAARRRIAELRKVAQTRVAADVKAAKAEIERLSVEVQTELIAGGLESAAAKAFLESMPTAESLMPALTVLEIEEATG